MNILFSNYETVIGFECHVQLKTSSKLFSHAKNQYGAPANELVDIVDIGLPGVLPSLNQKSVDFAIKLGLALGCTINRESVFARKHYFYPDLPKGYQISQFDKPICENGMLKITVAGETKNIRIRRIHIEEDAGKNIHVEGENFSYVDFNRAGTPLLEVVTEPDLRTPEEAMEAFKRLRQLVMYLNICDGNLQEGSMRADINVSVRKKGLEILGTRTETKNLNSFKYLGQAIVFESRRQIIELESGKKIQQETRLWDPNLKESRTMRSKEEAMDYRYFPDPDLPVLRLSEKQIDDISNTIPELPWKKLDRYQKNLGLNDYDARILSEDQNIALFFEDALSHYDNPKAIANWIINEILRSQNEAQSEEGQTFSTSILAENLASLVKLIDEKVISSSIAKKVFHLLESSPNKTPLDIVNEQNLRVVSDEAEILKLVEQILKENPEEVSLYRQGRTKVLGFLMGKLMALTKGKADAKAAKDLMLRALRE